MPPDENRSRPGEEAAPGENYNGKVIVADDRVARRDLIKLLTRAATLEAIRFRAVRETFLEASALYWQRRAATFAAVGTPKCDAIAEACRSHARLLSGEFGEVEPWPGFADDLAAVLREAEVV